MVWVGQRVGKRVDILAEEELRGGIKGESANQVLRTRQICRKTNTARDVTPGNRQNNRLQASLLCALSQHQHVVRKCGSR